MAVVFYIAAIFMAHFWNEVGLIRPNACPFPVTPVAILAVVHVVKVDGRIYEIFHLASLGILHEPHLRLNERTNDSPSPTRDHRAPRSGSKYLIIPSVLLSMGTLRSSMSFSIDS